MQSEAKFLSGYPNLLAWNHTENQQVYVWCKHDKKYHLHGYGCGGHRGAHCMNSPDNPKKYANGYNLILIGEMPDILKKDQKLKRPKGPAAYGYAEEILPDLDQETQG